MRGCVLAGDDIRIGKFPAINEMVFYYLHNVETGMKQAHTGIIAREQDQSTWIISGLPVKKQNVLFVITTEAHLRFRALTNPLAI